MARPTELLVRRNWYFTFWSAHVNTTFAVAATITSGSGDPTFQDIREMEEKYLADLQKAHGKERVRGIVCTGWYPLDDGEMTDGN